LDNDKRALGLISACSDMQNLEDSGRIIHEGIFKRVSSGPTIVKAPSKCLGFDIQLSSSPQNG